MLLQQQQHCSAAQVWRAQLPQQLLSGHVVGATRCIFTNEAWLAMQCWLCRFPQQFPPLLCSNSCLVPAQLLGVKVQGLCHKVPPSTLA